MTAPSSSTDDFDRPSDTKSADVKGEEVRRDLTEGQKGIKMTIAIQVVDYKTCQVVPDAFIDIWSTNATVGQHQLQPRCQEQRKLTSD